MSLQVFPSHSVIRPQEEHTHTFILLHERGNNFVNFGQDFLHSYLHARLPTVRFVFPAAPKSTASESTQAASQAADNWLDNHALEEFGWRLDEKMEVLDLEERKEVLCQAAQRIQGIIHEEARIFGEGGYQRTVLWGMGEGCAAGLFTLLGGWFNLHDKCALGALVGLSGWLPHSAELEGILRGGGTAIAEEDLHGMKVHNDSKKSQNKAK